MIKKRWLVKTLALSIILLFICAVASAFNIDNKSKSLNNGNWFYVGGSGEGNYTKIQDAINDSSNGDTVFVYDDSSPYYENIIVDKSIFLIGEDRNTTIIDGVVGGDVVSVEMDEVTIKEFSIQYHCTYPASDIAIEANRVSISKTIMISYNWYGISLLSCHDTNIFDNQISNKYAGISLRAYSNNNTILANDLNNNSYGLEINSSSFNHIFYNNFRNNNINAFDNGINSWNNEYPYAGNYWDDYMGEDNDGDGIGDTPYPIPGGDNEDRYPFMNPCGGWDQPPNKPNIYGPNMGKSGVEYTYCVNLSDPDNDSLYILWDWGDGTTPIWIGPFASGSEICDSHTWKKRGTYILSVTVKDIYGAKVTAYKEVTIPRNKPLFTMQCILIWLLEHFQNAFPFFTHLMK